MQINEIQMHEVLAYRKKVDQLEALVRRRDEIKAKIAEIDATLLQILGPDLFEKFHAATSKKTSRLRIRNTTPMADRFRKVFMAHPDGANLSQIASELGVTRATASTYIYCQYKHLVHKSQDENGTSVWFLAITTK